MSDWAFEQEWVKENNIVLYSTGTEMLRVAEDGFYVRGVKVPADEKEATAVYKAFKRFLAESELRRPW
jgi:hypothetical protein